MSAPDLDRVIAIICGMPEEIRRAVTLRKVNGFSNRQIAERLGLTLEEVDVDLAEGARLLAAGLDPLYRRCMRRLGRRRFAHRPEAERV